MALGSLAHAETPPPVSRHAGLPVGPLLVDTVLDDGGLMACDPDALGDCSLRGVLAVASTVPGEDFISFDPRVFGTAQTITLSSGQLVIDSPLTLTGSGAALLTISGNNSSRIFQISEGTSTVLDVVLSSMTLTQGNGSPTPTNGGGAIFNLENLTVESCVITGNTTTSRGGGISMPSGAEGGLTILDSTISGNTSTQGGGDVFVRNLGGVNVQFSTFSGNTGNYGGGIYLRNGVAGSTLENCTFSGNHADFDSMGNLNAGGGGAVLLYNGNLTMWNCTITGNTANATQGDGVHVKNNSYGGGGDVPATLDLISTIVSGNTDRSGSNDITRFADTDVTINSSYNLFQTSPLSGVVNGTDTGTLVGDPLLGPLAANEAVTFTHALLPGSPAIDTADPDCPAPATDQRAFPRPEDGDNTGSPRCDIGAYELAASTPTPTWTPTSTATATLTPSASSTPTATGTATRTATPLSVPVGTGGSAGLTSFLLILAGALGLGSVRRRPVPAPPASNV